MFPYFPYFIWNGADSRTRGMWINALPDIIRPEERVEYVTIPGRRGDVSLIEGKDIYNAYEKQCIITVKTDEDYSYLLGWLRGSGKVIFSNEPDREYDARIVSVQFQRIGNSLRRGLITFHCQPYKAQVPHEKNLTVSSLVTVYNPGDVEAKPLVVLTGTGQVSISIGKKVMQFTNLTGSIQIDCDAEIMTLPLEWIGEYLTIPKGYSTINVTNCIADIEPRWRWL